MYSYLETHLADTLFDKIELYFARKNGLTQSNMENNNETDPKKICLRLIDEMEITPVYDREKDMTTFQFTFPSWLKQNYSEETVKQLIDIITPALVSEMNNSTNKNCCKVIKENI